MKEYKKSTLMHMTKEQLIEYIRCLEHNEEVAKETLEQVCKNVIGCTPVVHGHWEKYAVDIAEHPWHCSVCGWSDHHIDQRRVREFNGCPMCFAKMDEVNNNERD